MAFLSTISKRIKYRTIEWLPERTIEGYKNGLKNIIKIPKITIKFLVMECTKKLNYFPPKGGVSKYYSPRETRLQQALYNSTVQLCSST
jgi:hypothetical protein